MLQGKLRPEEAVVIAFGAVLFFLRCSVGSCGMPASQGMIAVLLVTRMVVPVLFLGYMMHVLASLLKSSSEGGEFKRALAFTRDFFPLIAVFLLYQSLSVYNGQDMIHIVNPADRDTALMSVDQTLFGFQASVWMQRFIAPELTEVMGFFYSLHFFLPVLLALVFYVSGLRDGFRDFMLGIVLAGCIGYSCYFIVPAAGPQAVLKYDIDVQGGALTRIVTTSEDFLRSTNRSAFPSLHVGMSTVVLLFAWKHSRKTFAVLFVPVLLLWVSTVYLRQHYLIDVVAGWVLALACFYASRKINAVWYHGRT